MATKNLSRTVIEGGRATYSKWWRQQTHRIERANTREKLHQMINDDEAPLDQGFDRRPKAPRDFSDCLCPARRWLRAQIGRSWDKVRGEIFARFDTRTTAGRHIVFDHMLSWVDEHEVHDRWRHAKIVRVGRGGILRPIEEVR
jgi:hypothetical protein